MLRWKNLFDSSLPERRLTKGTRRKKRINETPKRRLLVETLEDRRMLAVITVDSFADDMTVDGQVTLREAIQAANTDMSVDGSTAGNGTDTINFAPALAGQTISLNGTELAITEALTIDASALATGVTIDAQQNSRVLNFSAATGDLTLERLTVTGGQSALRGGGINFNSNGTLTLNSSTVSGNSTTGQIASGGGISTNEGSVTLMSSTVSGNSTTGSSAYGGGIYTVSGNVLLTSSTVSDNSTTGSSADGGGIYTTRGSVSLTNSTVSGNSTTGNSADGGGIFTFYGSVLLTSSTVSGNSAGRAGGGVFVADSATDPPLMITDSIIAGNIVGAGQTGPDLQTDPDSVLTTTFSLIQDISTGLSAAQTAAFNVPAAGNLTGVAPLLGPLTGNGGPTQTHALMAGSPAIDAGNPAFAGTAVTDQRGAPFVRVSGAAIDMGAYERQTVAPLNLVVDTLVDENDGDYSAGDLSLREAVGLANGSVGTDTVTFAAALSGGTILLGGTEIQITEALTIDATALGAGLTVDAQLMSRVFHITATTGDYTLSGMTLTRGRTTTGTMIGSLQGRGGAVRSRSTGMLTIDQSTISGSSTIGVNASGGGVYALGNLNVTNSSLTGNSTSGVSASGGGLFTFAGATLTNSTVSGNNTMGTTALGGGIYTTTNLALTNSTVSGNYTTGASASGGGVYARMNATIANSTLTNNRTMGATANGGGIAVAPLFVAPTLTVTDSIIAANMAGSTGPDWILDPNATLTSSFSLVQDLAGLNAAQNAAFAAGAGNLAAMDPMLAPLAGNGGPTQTHALLATSPALDAGNPAFAGLANDQRGAGFARVMDGDNNGTLIIDMGAFEALPPGLRSVDVFLSAATGLMTISDRSGLAAGSTIQQNNDVTLTVGQFNTGGGNVPGLFVTDPMGVNALGAGVFQVSTTQAFVPDTAMTPTLAVDLLTGDDKLTVNVEGTGLISTPIAYDGGTGSDLLTVMGTPTTAVDTVNYKPGLQPDEGRVSYDIDPGVAGLDMIIDFDNLEPVVDLLAAINLVVDGNGDDNQMTYTVGSVITRGLVAIDGFETVEFSNKMNLVLRGMAGDDTIVANNSDLPTALLTLGILGGDGNDNIRLESLPDATTTTFVGVASAAGEGGDDTIDGSGITVATPLALVGGAGNDTLTGGAGPDVLVGDGGDDTLVDSPGADSFDGGAGNDTLAFVGTTANDTIDVFQNMPTNGNLDFYTLAVTNNGATTQEQITKTLPAVAPDNAANLPTIERILLNMRSGDDAMRVGHSDTYDDGNNTNGVAAQSIRFEINGEAPNASDMLVVRDDLLGDTVIQRIGADQRSGSITVGALAPVDYSGIEQTNVLPINQLTSGTGADAMGRLVVFKNDPFEANNTLQTATLLGAGPTINVDPTIDPGGGPFGTPADADFYQFVAQETGTLDFQLYFEPVAALANGNAGLPGNGELNATFFDSDGNPVAGIGGSGPANMLDGAGAKIGERITVPVVRNQTYFVRVQGDTANAINVYNFTAITIAAPVPSLVDLQASSDSGRNNTDDITNIATPTFNIILDDDRIDEFASINLLPDNNNDNLQTVGFDYGVQVFNNANPIGFAFYNPALGANTWTFTAAAGSLSEGDFNHISAAVWIRDRATPSVIGTHEMSDALQVTLDTMAPPISFGQNNAASTTDGLFDGSETGVATNATTFNDRVTSDTTPTFWGRAEADSIVTLYLDSNNNGTIEIATDFFLGQTVAVPLDGNNAFAGGSWEITANTDLNSVAILAALGTGRDGARPLLVTAVDQAGNPAPAAGVIGPAVGGTVLDALTFFVDTQGPQIAGVAANAQPDVGGGSYDLFDPKPSVNGPSPLINSITIYFVDQPGRSDVAGTANDFLYPALDSTIASIVGNYSLVGDSNGQIGIASAVVNQAIKLSGTLTAVTNATTFTDGGLVGAAVVPEVGDFITFNNGATAGLWQRVTAFSPATGGITVDIAAGAGPAINDGYSVVTAASLAHAVFPSFNTTAQETVTGAVNTTSFFAANITGGLAPAIGDYIRFNTGAAAGSFAVPNIRRVIAFNPVNGLITLDSALPAAPAIGDGFSLIGGVNNPGSTILGAFPANSASVTLNFATPLPDDRFTLTVSDNLVDPAGNKLDGETDAAQPIDNPTLSGNGVSGDGVAGGAFAGRFTVDTRPEIGVWSAGTALIDINGNLKYDLENTDATNRDINFHIGFASDNIFAGKFGINPVTGLASGFDTLAAYGRVGNQWRWLIDTNHDGTITPGVDIINNDVLNINGLPVAGNFDGNLANGDEIGVFNGTTWFLDTNRSFSIDPADLQVTATNSGFPIVGNFDGVGTDDLGTYSAVATKFGGNLFSIDTNLGAGANTTFRIGSSGAGGVTGFNGLAGVRERPVAADMNADGFDDIGLWVPDASASVPSEQGEWYFLVSGNIPATAFNETSILSRVTAGFLTYTPTPFGNDFSARFGNRFAVPLVGNFDPPVVTSTGPTVTTIATSPNTTTNSTDTNSIVSPTENGEEPAVPSPEQPSALLPEEELEEAVQSDLPTLVAEPEIAAAGEEPEQQPSQPTTAAGGTQPTETDTEQQPQSTHVDEVVDPPAAETTTTAVEAKPAEEQTATTTDAAVEKSVPLVHETASIEQPTATEQTVGIADAPPQPVVEVVAAAPTLPPEEDAKSADSEVATAQIPAPVNRYTRLINNANWSLRSRVVKPTTILPDKPAATPKPANETPQAEVAELPSVNAQVDLSSAVQEASPAPSVETMVPSRVQPASQVESRADWLATIRGLRQPSTDAHSPVPTATNTIVTKSIAVQAKPAEMVSPYTAKLSTTTSAASSTVEFRQLRTTQIAAWQAHRSLWMTASTADNNYGAEQSAEATDLAFDEKYREASDSQTSLANSPDQSSTEDDARFQDSHLVELARALASNW